MLQYRHDLPPALPTTSLTYLPSYLPPYPTYAYFIFVATRERSRRC